VAPSAYLSKLETGSSETPPILRHNLDAYLASHLIKPALLRANDFKAFMEDRQQRLLAMIEKATMKEAHRAQAVDEDDETDDETAESGLTMAAA
jgi:hypothetical protein